MPKDDNHDRGKDHEKTITIVIDGTPQEIPKKDLLTYAEVVALAFPGVAQDPNVTYSITYTHGHDGRDGILSPGGSVRTKEGISFRVNRSGQS